jgi:hypothetical protein
MKPETQLNPDHTEHGAALWPSARSLRVTRTTWELVGILDSLAATFSDARTATGHEWLRSLAVMAAEIEHGLLHRSEAGVGVLLQECQELAELLGRAPLALSQGPSVLGRDTPSPVDALRDRALATCRRLADLLSPEPEKAWQSTVS